MALGLAAMGSYRVGGRTVTVAGEPVRELALSSGFATRSDPNGTYVVEAAYVQYFEPAVRNRLPPVLLVHGGGLTGSSWETTPDGRPGWLNRLLEAGFAVHVIDNVERGRAGFSALPGLWNEAPVMRSLEEMWSLFRFGPRQRYARRRPFGGQQFPVEHLDALAARSVPRWTCNTQAQIAALTEAVGRFDQVILVGHSQGGGQAVHVAAACRQRVRAVVAIEPHGAPTSFEAGLALPRLLVVEGDFLDANEPWPALRADWRATLSAWAAAGGTADLLDLPGAGLPGNSHLPMMDRNGDAVLAAILRRLAQDEPIRPFFPAAARPATARRRR
ncbi:alpha/beta fold hydrolase [Bosea sp. (in: a-proteobacteria)]|uniref:alpha/beta fold hydrolase n=1 Tax=Bosea sp. (in: a-proteobacteria) TaxID=1871050 RepID=UPI00262ADF38|nr:alpha/beta fold hydrolase [Bosea sp. (in: a-proteobacteria)]MCO5089670.1 alpha/beta fold hydrolase [Bosea sp. (in: a-proteobacteria)]